MTFLQKIKMALIRFMQGRNGAEGLKIGFLHPKSTGGVLTEFCEDPKKK